MVPPTCPKCGNHSFELQEAAPLNSENKFLFVQCAACGTVVGVQDYYNIGHLLHDQATLLKRIARSLGLEEDL